MKKFLNILIILGSAYFVGFCVGAIKYSGVEAHSQYIEDSADEFASACYYSHLNKKYYCVSQTSYERLRAAHKALFRSRGIESDEK